MVIVVHNIARHWRVAHPQLVYTREFAHGSDAFDTAVALARDHYRSTGIGASVQVEAFRTRVEALRLG